MIALASPRVLIADPNEVLRAVYGEFLSLCGYHVATVSNALDCMSQLRTYCPEVLILEPELPLGGGDGVLALMHEDADLSAIPVIVVTAARDIDALLRVLDFPISDLQAKPLEPAQLARRIRWVLENPRSIAVCWSQCRATSAARTSFGAQSR